MKADHKHLMALICAIIITVCVPVCTVHGESEQPPQLQPAEGEVCPGITWTFKPSDADFNGQRTLTIKGEGAMPDWDSVEEVPWFEATGNSFGFIRISSGITRVGSHAFEHVVCPSADTCVSVGLADTVTSIGDYAFTDTPLWISLNNVVSIGNYAFQRCDLLTIQTFPEDLVYIGDYAYEGNPRLEMLSFLGDAPEVGETPFAGLNANAYLPHGNETWNEELQKQFGGSVKWYQKGIQDITTNTPNHIKKQYGAKAFSLGAKSSGDGQLTYLFNNSDVASIDKNGKVTIKGVGTGKIIIKVPQTLWCQSAKKELYLTVTLKGTTLKSVKRAKHKKIKIKWKRNSAVSGYQIQYATNKSFKKAKTIRIKKNSITSKKTKKLKKKKYYVRIRTFKKVKKVRYDNVKYTKTYYSGWSKVKTMKVK